MCTKIDTTYSNYCTVKEGDPQGSNLGPLLFLLYVNDIASEISYSQIVLFADDILLISIHYDEKL